MAKTQEELQEIAAELQLLALARRRFSISGDMDGVDLITRFFKAVQEIAGPKIVKSACDSVVGCGIGLSSKTLEEIKARVRAQVGEHG